MQDLGKWLSLADVWLEVVDARLPLTGRSSRWPRPLGKRKHVLVMNKADLAQASTTRNWLAFWESQGVKAVVTDARTGSGVARLHRMMRAAATSPGRRLPRATRVAVWGLPNVGKSSLINRLAGRAVARVGRRPGITRGPQWLRMAGDLELLDTAGDLNLAAPLDAEGLVRLAVLDIRPVSTPEEIEAAWWLAGYLGGERLEQRYGPELPADEDVLVGIARAKHWVLQDGKPDLQRAARALLRDFQAGRLGRCSLEEPPGLP